MYMEASSIRTLGYWELAKSVSDAIYELLACFVFSNLKIEEQPFNDNVIKILD